MEQNKNTLTAEQYIALFRGVAAIVDTALNHVATDNAADKLHLLDRVAEGVEFVASLRGDSGAFESTRPSGLSEYQQEMYATENQLRDKLIAQGYKYLQR